MTAREVAFQPDSNEWLVIEAQPVGGMPTLTVEGTYRTRGEAEAAAGFHGAKPLAWLLLDPVVGWRRLSGHGWVSDVRGAGRWSEAGAREIADAEPSLSLMVLRADGRVTCPDPAA